MTHSKARTVLLTGATGYIGSHTWCELIDAGYQVIGLDNLCNSSPNVLNRIKRITGSELNFIEGDVRDEQILMSIFEKNHIDAIVHFAALKAVGESVLQAQRYYENNIIGLLTLTRAMSQANVKTLVFSSSATVYGNAVTMPITEDSALSATSPYGRTKLISEQILQDIGISDESWHIACLRYFNPVGAHQSGLIGEDPRGVPNNLMPYVAQVAVGAREKLSVFGGDYSTPDGTGVRDYIHVTDLAIGHLAALSYLFKEQKSFTANLGTGQGYSVLEVIRAYERASGKHIPFEIVGRRAGDVPVCYANPDYAKSLLNWQAMRNLNKMCEDSWRWQNANPKGYADN